MKVAYVRLSLPGSRNTNCVKELSPWGEIPIHVCDEGSGEGIKKQRKDLKRDRKKVSKW